MVHFASSFCIGRVIHDFKPSHYIKSRQLWFCVNQVERNGVFLVICGHPIFWFQSLQKHVSINENGIKDKIKAIRTALQEITLCLSHCNGFTCVLLQWCKIIHDSHFSCLSCCSHFLLHCLNRHKTLQKSFESAFSCTLLQSVCFFRFSRCYQCDQFYRCNRWLHCALFGILCDWMLLLVNFAECGETLLWNQVRWSIRK